MYQRLCTTLNSVGRLIPREENIYNYIKNQNKDYYTSIYYYTQEQKDKAYEEIEAEKNGKKYKRKRGVAGMTDVVTDKLVFDFDSEDNVDLAKNDTIILLDRLNEIGIEDYLITFSGNKGFSVEIKTDKEMTPKQAKALAKRFAGDLKTFDPKVYNASRIFRLPFTKHDKTNLYKTPILEDELRENTISEIKELASQKFKPEELTPVVNLPDNLLENSLKEVSEKVSEPLEAVLDLDLTQRPKNLSAWKYALLNGYFPGGIRSHSLTILAATFRGQGYPKDVTYRLLKGAAQLQCERYKSERFADDEIWNNIIEQVYSDHWEGGTYSEENFPDDLAEYLTELGVPRIEDIIPEDELIESIDEGFAEFTKYAQEIEKNTVKSGIASLDKKLKIRKGHMLGLVAPPGVGKTSVAIEMLNNMSKQGMHCYFGSYDMYKNNVYQKLIQRHTGLGEDKIFKYFVNKDIEQMTKFGKILYDNYANVTFCYKVGQSIQDLKRSIKFKERQLGINIDFVVVDYIELILTEKSDATAASAEAAQGLREIANDGKVVLVLLQPNKMSSKPNEPITSYNAAKGSSAIAQAVTAMLTAHRPGLSSRSPEDDNFFSIDCVKNRNGALFNLDFHWEGKTQKIRELDDIEKEELTDLRKRKALEMDEDDI